MQNNYDNQRQGADVTYAGFWVRLMAYLMDSVIVFFLLLIVRFAMSGVMSALYGTLLGGNILFSYTLKDIVLYLGQVLYFILCTRYTGTTPGKRVLNLRVISAEGSGEPDLLTVAYRETVGRFLCGISVCIGYLIIGVDREKRGFHDMLCDTRVVYGKKVKVYPVYPYAPVRPVTGAGAGDGGDAMPASGTMAGSRGSSADVPPMPPASGVHSHPYRMVRPGEQKVYGPSADPASYTVPGERPGDSYGTGQTDLQRKEEKGDSSE